MSFLDLPLEIHLDVLALALHESETPGNILAVSRTFYDLCLPLLQAHLRFRSSRGLAQFTAGSQLESSPRTITLDLAGGAPQFSIFLLLGGVFMRCQRIHTRSPDSHPAVSFDQGSIGGQDERERLILDHLFLRLHSNKSDPNLHTIESTLNMVKYVEIITTTVCPTSPTLILRFHPPQPAPVYLDRARPVSPFLYRSTHVSPLRSAPT